MSSYSKSASKYLSMRWMLQNGVDISRVAPHSHVPERDTGVAKLRWPRETLKTLRNVPWRSFRGEGGGMRNSDLNSQQLSTGERLAVAWALVWPYALFNALMHTLQHIAASASVSIDTTTVLIATLAPFVIWTWAVRRAFRLRYSGFHFEIIRAASDAGDRIDYGASLSVAWLLMWRSVAIKLAVGIPFRFAWKLFEGSDLPSHFSLSTDLLLDALVGTPIGVGLYIWLLGGALRKGYKNFSIWVHRTDIVEPNFSRVVGDPAR